MKIELQSSAGSGGSSDRTLKVLTLATLIATYLLIVLGSTVRVTESGMGCKGWPLCSGQIGPIDNFHAIMEQSHRYLATIVTILICAVAVVVWRAGREAYYLRSMAATGVGVIVLQIILGAITVFTNNAPATVALHLIVGLLFLAIVTMTAVRAFLGREAEWEPFGDGVRLAFWALGSIFLVLISGSLVVDGGAEKACPSWPVCLGSHAQGGLIDLQLVHRAIVLIGTILVLYYLWRVLHSNTAVASQRSLSVIAVTLLIIQIGAGAVVAITKAPEALADIHLALAAALWSVLVATVAVGSVKVRSLSR